MQKTREKFTISKLLLLCTFFLCTSIFAQEALLQPPTFTAKTFPNGILYSFSEIKNDEQIKYKLYDPLSASSAEGYVQGEGSLFVKTDVTATVWIENGNSESLPIVLYPQQELPFANIDSAFVSPSEGEWANKQALVIDIPSDYEAYYSFTSSDPLISGFAYDGPVLIDMNGIVTIYIALVAPSGVVYNKSITYSVSDYAAFQPFSDSDGPVIECSPSVPIRIPENMSYYFGNKETGINEGRTLTVSRTNDIVRYAPLVIIDNNEKYRYVVQTGGEGSGVRPIPSVTGIEFFNWDFFSFDLGSSVSYSIDGSPWVSYINPVFIDRSVPHTIAWSSAAYYDGKVQFITVPPKPILTGVPESGVSNKAVTITTDDSDFVFRHETAKHKTDFLNSVYFDVLPGEKYTYNTPLSVYYKGVKQGTLKVNFTIDKQVPIKPQFRVEAPQYTTEVAQIYLESDYDVFVRISKKPIEVAMGTQIDFSPFQNSSIPYVALPTKAIELTGAPNGAMLYTIQAYSQNKTGTKSAVSVYTICVDTYNIFVTNANSTDLEEETLETGSAFNPFTHLNDALTAANQRKSSNIIVEGTHKDIDSFTLNSKLTISGKSETIAEFGEATTITIDGGSLTLKNMHITQDNQEQNSTSTSFFSIKDGILVIENSDISYLGTDSQTLIIADNADIEIFDSKINTTAFSYCAIIEAINSSVVVKKAEVVGTASAVELFNINRGDFDLSESNCTTSAGVGRIASLFNSDYTIKNNTFIKKGGSSKILQQAVQVNEGSYEHEFFANTLSGFREGLLQLQ